MIIIKKDQVIWHLEKQKIKKIYKNLIKHIIKIIIHLIIFYKI